MIKVLCMDDDNHTPSYILNINGELIGCSNAKEFMDKYLLKPHNECCVVKSLYICDPPQELACMDEDKFNTMFMLVESANSAYLDYFELFWEFCDD